MNGNGVSLSQRWQQQGDPVIRQYSRLIPVTDGSGAVGFPCLLKAPSGDDGLEILQNEIRILSLCQHPFIVPVVEARDGDDPYYVMPQAQCAADEQGCLADLSSDADRVLKVARGVAEAISYLHGNEVAHRDVCLGNVLIRGDAVWLGDFGLALRRVQEGREVSGERVFAADVAGLGKVLAGLVCGRVVEPVDFHIELPEAKADWGAERFRCLAELVQAMIAPVGRRLSLGDACAELKRLG